MAADSAEPPASPTREVSIDEFCRPDFWRGVAPGLTIEGLGAPGETQPIQDRARLQARMARDGYFGDRDPVLEAAATRIVEGLLACRGMGLPPVFIFLFDEPWACFQRLSPVIGGILGADYKLLPDFWAWHVDPRQSEAGWRPHRDKLNGSLAADGAPLSLTVWIPLTEATPLNSCIYLLPAYLDPFYGTLLTPESPVPNTIPARALPVVPGEYLAWNQAVLHWGSASSEFAEAPRMSMALEFQRGDIAPFNQPLLSQGYPIFADRLRLVGKQILQYTHMYGFSDQLVTLAKALIARP